MLLIVIIHSLDSNQFIDILGLLGGAYNDGIYFLIVLLCYKTREVEFMHE